MRILYSATLLEVLQNVLEEQAWLVGPFFESREVLCIFREALPNCVANRLRHGPVGFRLP